MKLIFAMLALSFAMSTPAFAQKYDSPIGECDSLHDEDDIRECQSWRTCIARDAQRNRFTFTGSYGKPNKYIVARAVEKCHRGSPQPSTCKVTVCRFGRY